MHVIKEWYNNIFYVQIHQPAKAAEDPLAKKRLNEEVDNVESGFLPSETVEEAIQRVCTPWWNVPYEQQVKLILSFFLYHLIT